LIARACCGNSSVPTVGVFAERPRVRILLLLSLWLVASTVMPQRFVAAEQTSRLGPWRIDEYHDLHWAQTDNAVTLTADKSAGLYFRTYSDAAARYRVVVKGKPLSGAASLRIKLDDGAAQYFAAPDGTFERTVAGAHDVEVMIYADEPFSYRLDDIALQPCPACSTAAERVALAGGFAPGATVQLYGDPTIERSNEADSSYLSVRGASGPAGVYLDYAVSPGRFYRLTITGEMVSGAANLRLDTDNDGPRWLGASTGTKNIVISGTKRLRLLLYSDAPFEYRISNIAIREDANAITKEKLRKIVKDQRPKLEALLATGQELPAIEELLQWTSGVVAWGYREDVADRNTLAVFEEPVEQSYEDVWQSDVGGAKCSAFAVFFAKVLNLFGFDALTVDVGYPEASITHVTTVVPITSDNGYRFYLFDPTLAGVFRRAGTGAYVDLASALEWDAGGLDNYRFATLTFGRKMFVPSWEEDRFANTLNSANKTAQCTKGALDRPARTVCSDFSYDVAFLTAEWKPMLRHLGLLGSHDLMTALIKTPLHSITDFGVDGKSLNSQHAQLADLLERFRVRP
jgi:hypothetical protein